MSTEQKDDAQPTIESVEFSQLIRKKWIVKKGGEGMPNLDLILDVTVPVSVELGRANMLIKDILALSQGSIVELEKVAGTPVELLVRGKLLARGEVVVVEERFGLKITAICGPQDRVR
ncbi:flagellar motor switch protein FliN, partial [Candidatus Kuenenia stuttgartiensis]|uniref:flagellar motor switch protein FliN n=1 Tax=Kuenenia stuttgartiensis TaxID=174633 RepID=UPI00146AA6FD